MTATLEHSHAAPPVGPQTRPALRSAEQPGLPPTRPVPRAWYWASIVTLLMVLAFIAVLLDGDGASSPRTPAPTTLPPPVAATTIGAASHGAAGRCAPPIPSWWPCPAGSASTTRATGGAG
jgi:hypothetical protein